MIVLIDAYNVIKYLLPHNRDEHDAQRAWLLSRMAAYRSAKANSITEVIVVFDGGMFTHRQREIKRGVTSVFAGRGRCADSVLIEYAERFGNQGVVVTNDRHLQHECQLHGAQSMPVDPFFALVDQACAAQEEPVSQERFGEVVVAKFVDDDEPHDAALDALMVAGSMSGVHKLVDDEDEPELERPKNKKKKNARAYDRLKKRL